MIKAFIFDVGGVLVGRSPVLPEILEEFSLTEAEAGDFYHKLMKRFGIGEIDEKTFWGLFMAKFNLSKPIPKPSPIIRRYQKEISINGEVMDIVHKLKEQGYLLAVISETISAHAEHLKKLGVFENFDEVILSYEVHISKPNPEIYKLALSKLNVLPEEAVFIDDRSDCVEGAENVGIKGILFTGVDNLKKELSQLAPDLLL